MLERYTFDMDPDVFEASIRAELGYGRPSRFIEATCARMSEELRLRVNVLAFTSGMPQILQYGAAHIFEGMSRQLEKDGLTEVVGQADPGLFENDALEGHVTRDGRGFDQRLVLDKFRNAGPGFTNYVKFGEDHLPLRSKDFSAAYFSGGMYIFGVLLTSLEVIRLRRELGA